MFSRGQEDHALLLDAIDYLAHIVESVRVLPQGVVLGVIDVEQRPETELDAALRWLSSLMRFCFRMLWSDDAAVFHLLSQALVAQRILAS